MITAGSVEKRDPIDTSELVPPVGSTPPALGNGSPSDRAPSSPGDGREFVSRTSSSPGDGREFVSRTPSSPGDGREFVSRTPSSPGDDGREFVSRTSAPRELGVWRALAPDFTSVGEARTLVRTALTGWELDEIVDDLVLVASELVSNALRHAVGVDDDSGASDPGGGAGSSPSIEDVWISLVRTAGHVICAVADPSRRPPVRRDADPMSGSGQGLALVESLSTCWGWDAFDDRGKSVWAIVPLGPEAWAAVGAA